MSGKIKISKENDDRIELHFDETPLYYLNAIRRYAINEVPTYAIDKVVVYTNMTSLFDEYIAHRIGLVPIAVDGEIDVEKVGFYLDFAGPGMIKSGDIKSNDPKVKVAVDNIPILKLKENQSLRLEGKLKLDIGRNHAKFQSGISGYEIIEEKENKVSGTMFVESLYQRKAKEILVLAIEVIEGKLKEISKGLESLEA